MEAHQRVVSTINCLLATIVRIHLYDAVYNQFELIDGLLYDVMGSDKILRLDGLTDLMTRATNRCVNNMCSEDPALHVTEGGGTLPPRRPTDPRSRRLPHTVTGDVADVVARYYADAIMDVIERDERVARPQQAVEDITNEVRNLFLANAHTRYATMLVELHKIDAVTVSLDYC